MIDNKILELHRGIIVEKTTLFTQDFFKDMRIIAYLAAIKLDKSIPFNLKSFQITEFNANTLLVSSQGHNYIITLNDFNIDNDYVKIDYTFFVNKNTD